MPREVVLASETSSPEEDTKEVDKSVTIASESDTKTSDRKAVESKRVSSEDGEVSETTIPFADDEEDVPSDFFDDFSNHDFMAGLDIVDAWDEEEFMVNKNKTKKVDNERDSQQRNKRKRTEKDKDRRRYSRSPVRRDRTRGSRDKDRKHRSNDKKSKEKPKDSKERDEQSADHRRDPEKTKRDIQKDKDKCAKNKEAKIISEKLKVVETGLVPPGTEMEVDLKQLKSVKEPEKKSRDEKDRHNPREEKPGERRRKSRTTSIERQRRHPKEKRRSRSPRSDEHKNQQRSRSPYRGRSRSPYYRDRDRRSRISPGRKLYQEERKRFGRYRNTSPTIIRRKSRERSTDLSPISNLSEREMWLRQRERDKRDRNISCSPVSDIEPTGRKRSQGFLEELANKLKSDRKQKSFLKEIQERLNESSHIDPRYSMNPCPGPVPPPMPGMNQMHGFNPVPGPGFMPAPPPQFFPHHDPAPQYDQQFFIGQPDVFHNPNPYGPPFMDPIAPPISAVHPISDSIIVAHPMNSPIQTHPPFNGNKNNVDLLKAQKAAEAQKEKDQEAVAKLFEDKKISLSDFLSVSAKHADPLRPVNVQKKIKVISLCQDAIKALGSDSKLSGRFFLKKTFKEPEKREETKFQSPLRKIPVVRFCFTTPSKGGDDKSTLQTTSNKLLASLGLAETARPATPKPALSPVSSEASVRSIPLKKVTSVKTPPPRKYDPILGAKFQMKMCQTDTVKCNICEIRKARKFVDQGTQYSMRTVDSGTQITEEDMIRMGIKVPMKDAFKNQSLAHLTPAQILAAQPGGLDDSIKKDLFVPRMLTPPPPDISPEKRGMLSNDGFLNRSDYHDRFKSDHFNSPNNNLNRLGGLKPTILFDKHNSGSFENVNRSHAPFEGGSKPNPVGRQNYDNRSHAMLQHNDSRFRGNPNQSFNQRMDDDEFDYEEPPTNYGGGNNQRPFLSSNRGNFFSGPYGGRKFL